MSELFGRQIVLQLGVPGEESRVVRDLRIIFQVDYKQGKQGEAAIEVYNPAPDTLAVAESRGVVARLFAGYARAEQLFEGAPIRGGIQIVRQGPDRILKLELRAGARQWESARVALSFATGTRASQIVEEAARALGLPRGLIRFEDYEFPDGFSYTGSAAELLDGITRAAGANVAIIDGALQVMPRDDDAGEDVAVFSATNGNLIGAPTRRTSGKDRGLIEVRAHLTPALRPGRRFVVQSERVNGPFLARDVSFAGDLYEPTFEVRATGREVR